MWLAACGPKSRQQGFLGGVLLRRPMAQASQVITIVIIISSSISYYYMMMLRVIILLNCYIVSVFVSGRRFAVLG